ncbi:hypothetical protein F383_23095 [Gossypium arboreum]|nr:hypothetical protein F383_23095 [Gossypium arboreum]
MCKKCYI